MKVLTLRALRSASNRDNIVGERGGKVNEGGGGGVVQGDGEGLAFGSCEGESEGGGGVEEVCDSLVRHGDKLKEN